AVMAACVHTVKIEPSDKPIKIDLHITQEVRIILDKQVEDMIADNPDLF
ncbi:MAG: YnbE family lipoprotein, partial [Hyphomonas sp.]|nr:YnbE family lipoprotein [Hyphomonas sp.]